MAPLLCADLRPCLNPRDRRCDWRFLGIFSSPQDAENSSAWIDGFTSTATPCLSCSRPHGLSRVAKPAAESSTILARCRSQCSVFVERAKPSGSARSSFVNVIGVAAEMPFMHPHASAKVGTSSTRRSGEIL